MRHGGTVRTAQTGTVLTHTTGLMWFLPTFHGDILLSARKEGDVEVTELRAFELTPTEEKAMEALRKHALAPPGLGGVPWASEKDFHELSQPSYRTAAGLTVHLRAPIAAVQSVLAPLLKPGREMLSAVRFSNGAIEEVRVSSPPQPTEDEKIRAAEKVKAAKEAAEKAEAEAKAAQAKAIAAKAKVVATVAEPVKSCPWPLFPEADVRAARVLEAFLDDDQIEDFRRHRAFVAVGADTGHRYRISDREVYAPSRKFGPSGRSLFDLDVGHALCVHDWDAPPPEEMLALLFCVAIPGKERLIRSMPEVMGHG